MKKNKIIREEITNAAIKEYLKVNPEYASIYSVSKRDKAKSALRKIGKVAAITAFGTTAAVIGAAMGAFGSTCGFACASDTQVKDALDKVRDANEKIKTAHELNEQLEEN